MRMWVVFGICLAAAPALAEDRSAEGVAFFETKIRPVLVARCLKCHGAQKASNGLRLDRRDSLLKGGKTGAAVIAGSPETSLLLRAIRYQSEPKMPPDKPLPAEVIADFERWIADGAPWPETPTSAERDTGTHWSFQPVRPVSIPAAPGEDHSPAGWDATPIDRFVFARLQHEGLFPAEPADRRTLLRRATFDLIGLPPTPAEIDAFLADESPAAFSRVVDRLLASPQYGERWARHWLDLVRYTDDLDEAWRYRDWVVNAFNDDLPFDQFVAKQIAGDLLPASEPGAVNADGIVATTMLSLGPWTGIDRKKRLTDIADDQIDIVSRSFLGLTIACARCHDHKFDPISTADYYGLAGMFFSSRVISDEGYLSHGTTRLKIPLVDEIQVERHRQQQDLVQAADRRLQAEVDRRYAAFAGSLLPQTARYLLAAWDYQHRPADDAKLSVDDFAAREKLQTFALSQWLAYLKGPRLGAYQPLDVPERDFDGELGVLAWRVRAERPWWAANTNTREVPIETFNLPSRTISINPGTEGGAVVWKSPIAGKVKITGSLADADPLDGVGVAWLIDHIRDGARHELSSGVCPNGTVRLEDGRTPERIAAVDVQPGDEIQLQIRLARGDAHYDITTVEWQISALDGSMSWDLVHDVLDDFLSGNPHRDHAVNPAVWQFVDMAGSHRLERMPAVDAALGDLSAAFAKGAPQAERSAFAEAAEDFHTAIAAAAERSPLIDDLTGVRSPFRVKTRDDAKYLPAEAQTALAAQAAELDALKRGVPALPCAHGVREGGLRHSLYPGMQDAPIHVRGDYDQLGDRAPRRFPAVLAPASVSPSLSGSGRLELARWLGSAENPLAARVLVNRLWQHHFGEGIVRTSSNFGVLGERPTHPELLDFLAASFVESGWSIKAMHRLILLSATYQQSCRADAASVKADPANRLLGRMNRRRLEVEALRDSLLAIAGRLDLRSGGPADGDASSPRRMLYLKNTRNNKAGLGPLFDGANAAMHVERRAVSTVAPQALLLMNDATITDAADRISRRPEVAAETDPARRIAALYTLLFGRPPKALEIDAGMAFVERETAESADAQTGGNPAVNPWAVYTQALLLSNEFLFVD